MKNDKGIIFDIQRFSIHDGPGIRTLVFLKGCSLHCKWCSNPDGIAPTPQIRYRKVVCVGCGKCADACADGAIRLDRERGYLIDRDKCRLCGKCVDACVPRARFWSGEYKTVDELYDMIKRDKPFFGDDGGMTLGGGDPLFQPEFARRILRKCKENGIGTAIETAGSYPFENLKKAAPWCDTIFFDIKGWDAQRHLEMTGADNKPILENLKKLDALLGSLPVKPELIVRIPLYPNFNITQNDMDAIGEFLNQIVHLTRAEILPFHNLGVDKYEQLDMDYSLKDATNLHADDVADFSLILGRRGVRHKVIQW